jgi:hypothetical protein
MKKALMIAIVLLMIAVDGFGQSFYDPGKTLHVIGETVPQFIASEQMESYIAPCENGNKLSKKVRLYCATWEEAKAGQTKTFSTERFKKIVFEQGKLTELIGEPETDFILFNPSDLIPTDKLPPSPEGAWSMKGEVLGMSLAAFYQKHPSCILQGVSIKGDNTSCSVETTYAGLPVSAIFSFYHQRLRAIEFTIPQRKFAFLTKALMEKYGAPKSTDRIVYKNPYGAPLKGDVNTWGNGVSTLTLSEYGKNDENSLYTLTLDSLVKEAQMNGPKSDM